MVATFVGIRFEIKETKFLEGKRFLRFFGLDVALMLVAFPAIANPTLHFIALMISRGALIRITEIAFVAAPRTRAKFLQMNRVTIFIIERAETFRTTNRRRQRLDMLGLFTIAEKTSTLRARAMVLAFVVGLHIATIAIVRTSKERSQRRDGIIMLEFRPPQ